VFCWMGAVELLRDFAPRAVNQVRVAI